MRRSVFVLAALLLATSGHADTAGGAARAGDDLGEAGRTTANGPIVFDDPLLRSGYENALCANLQIEDSEQCDDGNTVDGDGCAANCRYFNCGNSVLDAPFEECDDGGTVGGDGCDGRTCFEEAGFQCFGTPSVCTTICGDGLIHGTEACDDGNNVQGDGCNASCAVEIGFQCFGAPSACVTICGDGFVRGSEQCDDANTVKGDGCGGTCLVEPGFVCFGEPSVCLPPRRRQGAD